MTDVATTYRVQRHVGADRRATRVSIMFADNQGLVVTGDRGVVTTELLTIGAGGPTIGRVVSTGHEIDLREVNNITFLMPLAGRLAIRIGDRDYGVAAGSLAAFRPTERRTRSLADPSGRFAAATFQVPMGRLQTLAEAMGVSTDRVFPTDGMDLRDSAGRQTARSLPQLVDDLFRCPTLMLPPKVALALDRMIEDLLCEMMGEAVAPTGTSRVLPAFHRVRQAEEIMHDQSDEPLSMLQIAARLGVGLRSLQLAFADVHGGQSPRDVLRRIRLGKARHRLLAACGDGPGQVTRIAMDCGFFHLGRFAQAYARVHGERPSETLARRN